MNLLGIHFKMLIGEERAEDPAPLRLNQALQSVEVTHSDEGRSGFQLTFQMGRSVFDLQDYPLLKEPLLRPESRVILVVFFNLTKRVLMDGIITQLQPALSSEIGASTLTVTGEDVSLKMDREVIQVQYPNINHKEIVEAILDDYKTELGLQPSLSEPPPGSPNPSREEWTLSQHDTDLDYIKFLARHNGYVFYVRPASERGKNTAYWGPPDELRERQETLKVNMGPLSNVNSINFRYDGLAGRRVSFRTSDGEERTMEERNRSRQRAGESAELLRTTFLSCTGPLTETEIQARAQGMVNRSTDEVVTASGELDALRYGELLRPFSEVKLLGVGATHNGTYYVKRVTHNIDVRQGTYTQSFTLTREGLGVQLRLI